MIYDIPWTIKSSHEIRLFRIYDADPRPSLAVHPGSLPADVDPPLDIPKNLPRITPPSQQERFSQTPVYESLT